MTSVLLTLGRCIAGLLDLLRTKGLWLASARYGYLYGALELVPAQGEKNGRHGLSRAAETSPAPRDALPLGC